MLASGAPVAPAPPAAAVPQQADRPSLDNSISPPVQDKGIRSFFFFFSLYLLSPLVFSWPPRSWWLIIGPFINTANQYPTSLFFTARCCFPSLLLTGAFLYLSVRWVKLSLRFKRGPTAFHMTAFQYLRTPFGFETAPGENQVTQATQSGREGMWSHLIVESLYSEWWQSALWLCSVRWGLRLKPYTGKAPWWPWLVKCSHFHQEGASVQRLLRAGKLLLERQPQRAFGGDPCFLTFAAGTPSRKCISRRKTIKW